jgi:peroxiredoxin
VDWSDPALDRLPAVHEAAKAYARTLAQVGLPAEQQVAYGDALLNQIPEGTSRRKAVLLGMVASFQQPSPDAFVHFAKRYLTAFPRDNPAIAQQLQQQIQSREALLIGAVAPEIALPNPEGDTLRLSDLRGQVVLVDFWASWCRPCRQENPNVVRMYEKFHDQGFEIMGVSLDRNRGRWVQAIEADGLDWLHVSDLKYWSSQAARTYGVSSIPYTVLLDREGRIVAKRLRGAALKRKVKELLTSE